MNESRAEIPPIDGNLTGASTQSHRDMLEHLHNLLIRQGNKSKQPDVTAEEQFLDLKSHLDLGSKVTDGKKWNWDQDFAQLIDLRKHRAIIENFEHGSERIRDPVEQAESMKESFESLRQFVNELIGRSFVLH